jgi:hypothetical protein
LRDWLDGGTVVLQRAPRRRTTRRRRVAVALAAALAAAVAAGVYFLPPRNQPVPPPETPPTGKPGPRPGVWQDVLEREPTPIRWPDWMKKEMRYDPAAKTLHVSATDFGLVALGGTEAPRWRLAMRVRQTPWAGNVGVFFGYRAEPDNGEPADHYQLIQLVSQGDADAGGPFRLDWKEEAHRGEGRREQLISRAVLSSSGFRLAPGEHRLELTIGPDGLESVVLDKETRLGRQAGNASRPPSGAACAGRFGIMVRNGNGDFSEIQYLFTEEPQ